MIPDGYKTQDGCWNCNNIFIKNNYASIEFCCHYDKSEIPKSEDFWWDEKNNKELSDDEGEKLMDAWDAWKKNHQVSDSGICPKWEGE